MKTILLSITCFALFSITSCNNADDSHTHGDGTVHKHETDHTSPAEQESFELKEDTASKKEDKEHSHHEDDGATHKHHH